MENKKKLHRVHGIMPVLAITAILYARNNRADLKNRNKGTAGGNIGGYFLI